MLSKYVIEAGNIASELFKESKSCFQLFSTFNRWYKLHSYIQNLNQKRLGELKYRLNKYNIYVYKNVPSSPITVKRCKLYCFFLTLSIS